MPQEDIVLTDPTRFYPRMPMEDVEKLEPLFCVDSMENSRVFSTYRRDPRIVSKYHEELGLSGNYTTKEMNNALLGKEVFIVRRPVINGVKQDYKLAIEPAVYKNIEGLHFGYELANAIVDINGVDVPIKLDRVFLMK